MGIKCIANSLDVDYAGPAFNSFFLILVLIFIFLIIIPLTTVNRLSFILQVQFGAYVGYDSGINITRKLLPIVFRLAAYEDYANELQVDEVSNSGVVGDSILLLSKCTTGQCPYKNIDIVNKRGSDIG